MPAGLTPDPPNTHALSFKSSTRLTPHLPNTQALSQGHNMSQHILEQDFPFSDPDQSGDEDSEDEDDFRLEFQSPPTTSALGSGVVEHNEMLDGTRNETEVGEDTQNPEPPESSPVEAWSSGDGVTIEERAVLLGMATNEERTRAINIRRREAEELKEGLINQVTPIIPKVVYVKKAASKGKKVQAEVPEKPKDLVGEKGKGKPQVSARRRSDRQKPSAAVPALSGGSGSLPPILPITVSLNEPTIDTTLDEDILPEWIDEALLHFNGMCDNGQWAALLVKWIELERLLGFLKD